MMQSRLQAYQTPQLVRQTKPTSVEAHTYLLRSGKLGEMEAAYLKAIVSAPHGLTDREAASLLHKPASTISGVRNRIIQKNGKHIIINNNGERRTNKGGMTALVWRYIR